MGAEGRGPPGGVESRSQARSVRGTRVRAAPPFLHRPEQRRGVATGCVTAKATLHSRVVNPESWDFL